MVGSAHAGCAPPDCAPAEGWDNFANNLGSDLAPLLALFGEQVTTQYLSETLNWRDCLLFALAPIGIITAIVAAIRVAGNSMLRSVIGRAKESRGDVEADLMSSTSSDVCELWSGGGVVRVLGSPKLLQLVYVESQAGDKETAGIFNFQDTTTQDKFYKKQQKQGDAKTPRANETLAAGSAVQSPPPDPTLYSDIEKWQARNSPPNLSLNVSIKPIPLQRMVVFLIVGIFVQGAVLVLAAVSQYKLRLPKNNASIPGYAFPVFLIGTVTLAGGMFLCARAIETSTKETTWEPLDPETTRAVWLQQGGQKVGDQEFESFARVSAVCSPGVIHTSQKAKTDGRTALVATAVCITLLGFIAQFFGLRATHSSVIVLQLCAILLMTALRSYAHVDRENHNHITQPDMVKGYELDWLAKNLKHCSTWKVVIVPRRVSKDSPTEPKAIRTSPSQPAEADEKRDPALAAECAVELMPVVVMRTRARLARLSGDWDLESRKKVAVLQSAIEGTMNDVFANMKLKEDRNSESLFEWGLPVRARPSDNGGLAENCEVKLTLTREKDETGSWGGWKADESELEAILCLWVSSLAEFDRKKAKKGNLRLKQVRLLGPASIATEIYCKLWLHPETKPRRAKLDCKSERYFGWSGSWSDEYLCVDTKQDLEALCAQGFYTLFLERLGGWVGEVGGTTTQRANDFNRGLSPFAESESSGEHLYLSNTNLTSIAQIFVQCGLGTIEDAYQCIVPAFNAVQQSSYLDEIYNSARKTSKALSKEQKWKDVAEIDSWLYLNSSPINAPASVIEAEAAQRLRALCERLLSGIKKGEANEDLQILWKIVDSECLVLSTGDSSKDLSFSMLTRCMTYWRINSAAKSQGFPELVWKTIEFLTSGKVREGMRRDVQRGWEDGVFKESESFAKFLFNQIYNGLFEEQKGPDSLALVIALIREQSGDAFFGKEIEMYLNNPVSLKIAADTPANPPPEAPCIDIPIDLLLSRQYLSPLQLAAGIGNKGVVERLVLDAGAEVNAEPAQLGGRTALQAAASGGHYEVVKFLLERSADPKARPAPIEGRTALQAAAGAGNRAIVELLLEAGVNADAGEFGGRTALQAAAEGGHKDIVQFLHAKGAAVNGPPARYNGRTALQAAAGAGHSDIVHQLLELGATINETPKSVCGRTALQAAAQNGHEEIVELLLTNRANVDAEPAWVDGRTALQAAAGAGHGEVLKLLLRAKADVNAKASVRSGRTALQAAVEGGHKNTVNTLLWSNADTNAPPAEALGITVLQAALEDDDPKMVQLIVTSSSFDVEAALHSAEERGQEKVLEHLLESKDVDWYRKIGVYGETPLHQAIRHRHDEVFQRLLGNKDIDPNVTDAEGRSPLFTAVSLGHEKAVGLLVSNPKVDVNLANSKQSTPILVAASIGHVKIVSLLLERPEVDVNRVSLDGHTPLHAAAIAGHDTVIRLLLRREGLNINTTDIHGATPLHFASQAKLEVVVGTLLSWGGVDVNHRDARGLTPLMVAASVGADAVVRRLLGRSEILLNLPNSEGYSPLLVAALNGHQAVFEQLLAKGADVNHQNLQQATALHMAASAGHVAIVEMLLNVKGVQADLPDTLQWTPLTYAAVKGYHEVVQQLLRKDVNINHNTVDQETPLLLAAKEGHESIVEMLLAAQGIDIDFSGSSGDSPLNLAARGGHLSVVERLLAEGVDVNHSNKQQATPLLLAAVNGHDLVVKRLLKVSGIDVNLPNTDGDTPLFLAAKLGHYLVVEQLLTKEDVDLDAPSATGLTPLLGAAKEGYEVVVKQLLDKGVDVNQQNSHKTTALSIAAVFGRNKVVEVLLKAEVDVNLMDRDGDTPLLRAAQRGHEEVVKLLLAAKEINVNCADSDKDTPLMLAVRSGHEGVVKQLLAHKDINVNLLDAYGNTIQSHAWNRASRMLLEQARTTQRVPRPTQG